MYRNLNFPIHIGEKKMSFLSGPAPPAASPPPPAPPQLASSGIKDSAAAARAAAAQANGGAGFDDTVGASGVKGSFAGTSTGGKTLLGQ
jgi:hypothetical protein